nr:MAG TPA: hypothetical protein [Caudoviricetes sp.]
MQLINLAQKGLIPIMLKGVNTKYEYRSKHRQRCTYTEIII